MAPSTCSLAAVPLLLQSEHPFLSITLGESPAQYLLLGSNRLTKLCRSCPGMPVKHAVVSCQCMTPGISSCEMCRAESLMHMNMYRKQWKAASKAYTRGDGMSLFHNVSQCRGAVSTQEAERWRAPPGQLANLVMRDLVCSDRQFVTRLTRCSIANN